MRAVPGRAVEEGRQGAAGGLVGAAGDVRAVEGRVSVGHTGDGSPE